MGRIANCGSASLAEAKLQIARLKLRAPQLWLLVVILLAGCSKSGPQLAPVSGHVTLDGQPLESADVVFQPDDMKSPSYGRTDADGRYDLGYKRGVPGAMVGWHTVKIAEVTEITHRLQRVPPRYNTESELRRAVKSNEENKFDFELASGSK